MNLKGTIFIFLLLGLWNTMLGQLNQSACIQDATVLAPGGQTVLYFCNGDGAPDKIRFRVTPFAQPFAYLITDDKNNIILVSRDNNIDFEGLPPGNLRVWAFAFKGNILAQPGQDATTAILADYCYALTQNFIPISSIVPNGGTVATVDGMSSLFTCAGDGNADAITFTTTSTDPLYKYVITNENNVILAIADSSTFDFEPLQNEKVRVWGVSYIGTILAEIGDTITTVRFASNCFDLSDNFVEVLRSKPEGGTVSLSNGETTKTLCAEDLQNDILTFVAQNNAPTPYAFIITDDSGLVLQILSGNTATLSISAPGICRGYGVSYTGTLTVAVGDNINSTALSDDCFDVSSNFVRIIKREVDGGLVRLSSGSTSSVVCVSEGVSQAVTFTNNSSAAGSNYTYLITNINNIIVAIVSGNTFNFTALNTRDLRVWGLSYSGTLLAKVGDNIATAALSGECYDLSDNFISITRQAVDGAAVSLESGATSAVACTGDGRSDVLAFRNTSTSLESYIYVVTNTSGIVIGFINGHQFDFNNLTVDTARVYGLSYSGAFQLQIGDNINTSNPASNCFDLSNNFVIVTNAFVDGATVSLANGSDSAQVCLGSATASTLTFINTSTATVNYGYIVTNTNNIILDFYGADGSINFSVYSGGEFRVWGFSFTGATGAIGGNVMNSQLSNGCYELSSNFVTITTDAADGGDVSLTNGETTAFNCLNDTTTGLFTFVNDSRAENDTYYYIVANNDGTVLAIDTASSINLSQFSAGTYRVYGLSITGNLQLAVGGNVLGDNLSSECFDRSSNFIAITQSNPDGGTVRLENDSTSALICTNADSTVLRFENTSTTSENYAYIITDTNNIITAILPTASFNFAGATNATFRVWGVSYSGSIIVEAGDNITTADITNGCFELSSNFITVTRQQVDGATVSLEGGGTSTVACLGVAEIGELGFVNTSTASANYIYLVTDTLDKILAIVDSSYNFNNLPIGTYRVLGLSYTGNLLASINGNIGEFLSDACYDLSSNFITVTQKDVDGGTVALENGDTSTFVCGNTSTPGTLTFTFDSDANGEYVFLVTDRNNRIIVVLNGNSVSFNAAAIGEYRVWGASYTGNLLARVGARLDTLTLSDECFDLSDNFVRILRDATDGGNIAETGNRTSYTFCPGNGRADLLTFLTTGNSSGGYIYILTDNNNLFISQLTGNSINFDTLPVGNYRIRGLAFSGNLTLQSGANVTTAMLSDACFDLSNNFISITNQIPNGGAVSLEEGLMETFTCPADNDPDILHFFSQGAVGTGFVFLVTDTNNIIEAIVAQDSFDFERPTEGVNRVYGLAYSGNLTVEVGDTVTTAMLSEDCFDLSNNFITITREIPNGGIVSLENGDSSVFVCANSTDSQVVQFDSTGTSRGEYIYVITDSNNIIRNGIAGDQFDFSFLSPPGVYRVWGLAYTGMLIATIGDTVTNVAISDDCYTLSENYVTVTISSPDGGAITANGSANPILICAGDGAADTVRLANNSQAFGASYVYLVMDDSNHVFKIIQDNLFTFEDINEDTVRVWGLSYSGELLIQVGDDADLASLASGCADLSSNFVQISRANVDGANIGSDRNASLIYTCYNDDVADIITFSNTSSAEAQYRYVITNENNIIRGVVNGSQFDFETAGRGVSRIWGVSFTGTFTGAFGSNITTSALSNACFDLSNNFITIARDTVFGGEILADNLTNLTFCPSPETPGVVMTTTSEKLTGYQYILTDTFNTVLQLPQGDTIRFDSLPVGNYRIWGLSYAGAILVEPGDNILGVDLASSCYEISASFVTVYRSTVIDGGRVFNLAGSDVLNVCASDTLSDVVVLDNNSDGKDAQYRYVLTDGNNRIILRNIDEVIDFNQATRGVYHIWGVSYTGEFIALANDNLTTAILTDSCYQLSENFITINVQTPNPGRVLTSDTLSAIALTVGDDTSDVVSFIAIGAAGGTVDYLVTDSADVIVAIITNDSIDFESFDPGTYRVRSVGYTGNLTVAIGDTATTAMLSDGCYALSASSVRVTLSTEAGLGDPTLQTIQITITVAPNPATDNLRINHLWNGNPNPSSNLSIFNLIGQRVYETNIPTTTGANQYSLDLKDMPDGLYILQLRNGAEIQSVRFLKQWQ